MKKKNLNRLLILSMAILLTGCGATAGGSSEEADAIELIEPVNAETGYEEAAVRNLYNASMFPATVVPYIEEYGSDRDMEFESYGAYPGEQVKKGQALIRSNTDEMDKKIEDKEKSIADMEEAFQKEQEGKTEVLKEQMDQANYWKVFVDANEAKKPVEYIQDSETGGQVKNPAYEAWEAECGWVVGEYRIAEHRVNTTKLEMEQKKELYELDHAWALKELENLKEDRNEDMILSKKDGTVVAMKSFNQWDSHIPRDAVVTAVGDLSQKLLKCDYIRSEKITRAQQVYAFINGRRYEVEYQPMDPDEYLQLSSQDEKVYSTLKLLDAEDVNMGDFAVLTVISDYRENVVTVPAEAVRQDETGSYVYVVTEDGNIYTPVKVGMSDDVYTEITEGVSEGDKILYNNMQSIGSKTAKVETGDFGTTFSERGWMEYPSSSGIVNPIENGTVYFVSSDISLYQHVEKGDVIARVRVEPDSIALERNETKLKRLRDRVTDLEKLDPERNKEAIESYREQIADLEEDIAGQKADFATTEIVADKSGIVLELADLQEEKILPFKSRLAQIADESNCYVMVEDTKWLLQYGNEIEITYENENRQKCKVTGTVSMVRVGVKSALQSDYALIRLPQEEIGSMSMTASGNDDWWSRYRYDVAGEVRKMSNVPIVPNKAVWTSQGQTYVYVKNENGDAVARSFLAGGFNNDYYWVVDGLAEGMEVCLE